MKSKNVPQRHLIEKKYAALVLLVLGSILSIATVAFAQSSGEDWAEPINLSRSSGTNNPRIVVDSNGMAHAIWTNSSNSFSYTVAEDEDWSQPIPVEFPFGTRRFDLELVETAPTPLYAPELFADQSGKIHALWRDEEQTLFQSSVNADQFAVFEAWSPPQQVAEAALDMQLAIDGTGRLHLSYIRPLESNQFPAGIYYRQSSDDGATWSVPVLLHQSPYFQSIDGSQAKVHLAVSGPDQVVVAWEDPLQESLFTVHSGNGGGSWDPIINIDHREETDSPDSSGPGQLDLASVGDSVHLLWQAGHQGYPCNRFHQFSTDGGATWQPKQKVFESIAECAMEMWFVSEPNGDLLVVDETQDATYIAVWNGKTWSKPSPERAIKDFLNPLTYRSIALSCKQPVIRGIGTETSPYSLTVIGCESNHNRDTWLRSTNLSTLIERISPSTEPIWKESALLTTAIEGDSLSLIGDSDGYMHALWTQQSSEDNLAEVIYYSRWDGATWSSARQVLSSPDETRAINPSVIFAPPDRLQALWMAGHPGEILFSQSSSDRAAVSAEWSAPVKIPIPRAAATNPRLARDGEGFLYASYAISLNEDRGIYLTKSLDGGDTWLDPIIVFDAAEAMWDMVDNPRLSIGEDGTIHLMWQRYASPPLSNPMSVHYSRSIDGGLTWSEQSEVNQGSILWGEPLAVDDRVVHRLWFDANSGIWHEMSFDSGLTWGQLQRLPGNQNIVDPIDMTLDAIGRLHVAAIELDQESRGGIERSIRHWMWSEDRWIVEESLKVKESQIEGLALDVTSGGELIVLHSAPFEPTDSDRITQEIRSSGRQIELPLLSPTPLPTLTPQPTPQPTTVPTQTPEPTATIFFSRSSEPDSGLALPIDTSNPFVGPLVGIIPAAIVILVAFFVVIRIVRGGRR